MAGYEQLNMPSVKDIALPRRQNLGFPVEVYRLVNNSIKAAYPGANLPNLRDTDIRVVSDEQNLDFLKKIADRIRHSYLDAGGSVILDSKGTSIDAMVMPFLPSKPMFVSESYLASYAGIPLHISQFVLAHFLIHERIHQLAGSRALAVRPSTAMFERVALVDEYSEMKLLPDTEREEKKMEVEELGRFVAERDPMILVEGGLVELFCRDSNRKRRKILSSAYDFNEGVAEYLAEDPRRALIKEMGARLSAEDTAFLTEVFESESSATVRYERHPVELIDKRMKSIGLRTPTQVMQLFRAGAIPERWVQTHLELMYPARLEELALER